MQVDDIRVFIPAKNYEGSIAFYQQLGFDCSPFSEKLTLCENGECSFFLQDFYQKELAENLMLQLSVLDLEQVHAKAKELAAKLDDIVEQPWGKMFNLWGPSGELWHVIQAED